MIKINFIYLFFINRDKWGVLMKIGVFAYNFEHKKTQEGLLNLFLNGYKVECIMAADPVKLTFYQSKIRMVPKGLHYAHPKKIAERLGIPYHVVVHNSKECERLIKKYKLDVGIILGARILKHNIISAFKMGVINLHPGLIPKNRGLDNVKWAILKGYKQGVTVHFINEKVDHGRIIMQKTVDVYPDDTLLDVQLRIHDMEQLMMIESLKLLEKGKRDFKIVGKDMEEGVSFKAVPPEEEAKLLETFEEYKKRYNDL